MRLTGCFAVIIQFCIPMLYVHWHMPLFFTLLSLCIYFGLILLCKMFWNVMVPLKYLETASNSRVTIGLQEIRSQNVEIRAYRKGIGQRENFNAAVGDYLKAKFLNTTCMNTWVETRIIA